MNNDEKPKNGADREATLGDKRMGRNRYARHQGVSGSAVTRAIRSGRISAAVTYDDEGVPSIDWRKADQLWRQNTDPRQAWKTRDYDRDPFPPDSTPEYRLSILVGQILGDAAIGVGAHALVRHRIKPKVSIDILCFTLLCLNMVISPDPDTPMWLPPGLEPGNEAGLAAAIRKYAKRLVAEGNGPAAYNKRIRHGKSVS